ncbi:MAG: galactose oxidase-like domain-containing protein, partial [Actinoallomurus sp.]
MSTRQSTGGSTISAPALTTAGPDELLLAFVSSDGPNSSGSQSIAGVSGGGLTWTLRRRANAQPGTAEIWQAAAPAKLTNATITATRASSGYQGAITVAAFAGADPATSGATASGSAASGAPSISLTTTRAGSMVWGVGDDWTSATARALGAGQTLVDQFLSPSGDTFWTQRRTAAAPTAGSSVTIDDTAPTGDRWNLAAVEVLAAEGGSELPPDTTPPMVSLTAPAAGATLSGSVSLTASASDASGIAGVRFLLDGNPVGSEDASAPYGLSWDSTAVANGPHSLAARATDGFGNIATSSPVAVTVSNGGGGGEGPAQVGQWGPLMPLPAVAIHSALLPNGRILIFQGDFAKGGQQYVFDPNTGTSTQVPDAAADLFCAGQAVLADGRVLVVGGTSTDGGLGVPDITAFNWNAQSWEALAPMRFPRWYATGTTLANGKVLATSGVDKGADDIVTVPELYTPATNSWQSLTAASRSMPIYPFIYQLPDGRVAHLGGSEFPTASEVLDLTTNQWTTIDSRVIDGGSIANYAPGRFIKAGSAADDGFSGSSAKTAFTLDMNTPGAIWQPTANMKFARSFLNLTNLPDGTVLATGGGTDKSGFVDSNAVLPAEDWNPATGAWTTYAAMAAPRLYHSVALLLPDGRVYVAGGGGDPGVTDQRSAQIFSPPYLFKGPRPTIASAPTTSEYGATEFVGTPDAASISRVSMIRTGSVTHAFDQNARATSLAFAQTGGGIDVQMPANRNDVPPGYYMLFIVNGEGVPSVASFVRFPAPEEDNVPPTAPSGLSAVGGSGTASLSWTAASDKVGVTRYNVHRSSTPGFTATVANRIGQTSTTSLTDVGVPAGTWHYKVTAEDAAGNVGPPSGEASATVTAAGPSTLALDATVSTRQSTGGSTISAPALTTAGPDELLLAFVSS